MRHLKITVDGKLYDVTVEEIDEKMDTDIPREVDTQKSTSLDGEPINAPMSGNIISVAVENGQSVKKGDTIVILEAMKMENEILAPRDGKILQVNVSKGQKVEADQVIALFK